jgi:hypothetical protein
MRRDSSAVLNRPPSAKTRRRPAVLHRVLVLVVFVKVPSEQTGSRHSSYGLSQAA